MGGFVEGSVYGKQKKERRYQGIPFLGRNPYFSIDVGSDRRSSGPSRVGGDLRSLLPFPVPSPSRREVLGRGRDPRSVLTPPSVSPGSLDSVSPFPRPSPLLFFMFLSLSNPSTYCSSRHSHYTSPPYHPLVGTGIGWGPRCPGFNRNV